MDAITIGFIFYLVIILLVGFYTSRITNNLKDFALGGQRLGPTVIAFSERASGESAWLILGLPGAALLAGFLEIWTVVGCVGGIILSNAISQTRPGGIVAACGNAANIRLNTTVMPFIIRGVKLWGIDSVMISKKRREFVWSQVADLIDFKFLEKHTKTVNLEELLTIFPNILKGEIAGRVLVDLNK